MASDRIADANDSTAGVMSRGRDKSYEAYDEAKATVGDKSENERITDRAKETYENAKEKASQATGNLGAKMRQTSAEL